MKTISYFLTLSALIFSLQLSFAQEIITVKHSCSFDGEELDKDFYTFDPSNEADKIVKQIVESVSLQKNFFVKSSDCKNALATSHNGKRYILYNTSFLEKFKADAKTKWAAYCVMAHEIGHHLNGHDFEVTDKRKRKSMELEADIFAGGVLYALGASLDEAKAGIDLLQSNGENDTHPPARARAEALASGWKKKQELFQGRQSDDLIPEERRTSDEEKKDEPTFEDKKPIKKPPVKPHTEIDDTRTPDDGQLTAVSDQLMYNNLIGYWTTSFYNDYGQLVVNNLGLFPDGSMRAQMFSNGVMISDVIQYWGVQGGQFVETSNGVWNRYNISFNGNNMIKSSFAATNGVAYVPIGTSFTFTRYQP